MMLQESRTVLIEKFPVGAFRPWGFIEAMEHVQRVIQTLNTDERFKDGKKSVVIADHTMQKKVREILEVEGYVITKIDKDDPQNKGMAFIENRENDFYLLEWN